MKKLFLISVVFVSFLAACETNVDIKVPKGDDMIVVDGVFHVDSTFIIRLSKSQYVLSDSWQINYLNNATVKLFKNNSFVENLQFSKDGLYFSPTLKCEFFKEYSLEITAPEMKNATTKTQMPAPVTISSFTSVPKVDYGFRGRIKFNDPTEIANYYLIDAFYEYKGQSWEQGNGNPKDVVYIYPLMLYSDDPQIDANGIVEEGITLSDNFFNGKPVELSFEYDIWEGDTLQVFVKLNSITRDHYLFLRSKSLQGSASDNPLAEPVQVYNNVDGGLGIFSGMSCSIYSFEVINQPVYYKNSKH